MTMLFVSSRGKTNSMLKQLDKTSIAAVVDYAQDLENRLSSTQRQLTKSQQESTSSSRQDAQKIATLQKENRLLQQQADDLKKKHEGPQKVKEETQRLQDREMAFSEQVAWLQASARRESKRAVLER
jgi:small-conductance mechanosensitive channel